MCVCVPCSACREPSLALAAVQRGTVCCVCTELTCAATVRLMRRFTSLTLHPSETVHMVCTRAVPCTCCVCSELTCAATVSAASLTTLATIDAALTIGYRASAYGVQQHTAYCVMRAHKGLSEHRHAALTIGYRASACSTQGTTRPHTIHWVIRAHTHKEGWETHVCGLYVRVCVCDSVCVCVCVCVCVSHTLGHTVNASVGNSLESFSE